MRARRGPFSGRPRIPRRLFRRGPGRSAAVIILLAAAIIYLLRGEDAGPVRPVPGPPVEVLASGGVVAQVTDGDTIVLEDGHRVRYAGIDAPEAEDPFHDEATARNRALVAGRGVRLERSGPVEKDGYGRLLSVVHAGDAPRDPASSANAEMVRSGLASVYIARAGALDEPFLRALLDAQAAAISARRGVWSVRLSPAAAPREPLVATRYRIHRETCAEARRGKPRSIRRLEDEFRAGRSLCRLCKPLDGRPAAQRGL
ncbi:MAG TPA: thermonuclease family protein [Planctomycetota bacterium]|nr:thermonuclease family protein [Planctomycetota bacterium]